MSTVDEMQGDECPICLQKMPALTWLGTERRRLFCCGNIVCNLCFNALMNQKAAISINQTATDRQRLPDSRVLLQEAYDKLVMLGKCPICNTIVPTTDESRLRLIRVHAERNKAWAQRKVGQFLLDGIGTPINATEAVRYLLLAAEQGEPFAQTELAGCYMTGRGTRRDMVEAIKWLEKANLATSQWQLANILLGQWGADVPTNIPRAILLLQSAAKEGLKDAYDDLAHIYENQGRAPVSLERTIYLNRKAAEQGCATAQAGLAGNLLHQAAMLNDGDALIAAPEVLYWARKSAAAGIVDAKHIVELVEPLISRRCAYCQNPGILKSCGRCAAASYCSKDHQKAHWKVHKKSCFDVKAANAEYDRINNRKRSTQNH